MRLASLEKGPIELASLDGIQKLAFNPEEQARGPALQFLFDTGDVFVDKVDDIIVAFAIVTLLGGQPFLRIIATAPAWQKQGRASRLLKEIVDFYVGKEYIDLTCRSDNPAQKLYFDHGWRVRQVLRNYYNNPITGCAGAMDGLRMRRIYQ